MRFLSRLSVLLLVLVFCFTLSCGQKEKKEAMEDESMSEMQPDNIPQMVMDGLKAKFPQAEIQKFTHEMEGEMAVYDIEFMQDGVKCEADIADNGTIMSYEKAIMAADLPEAAKMAVEAKYPGMTMKEIMEITAVTDGEETLEGYEVVCENSEMQMMEVMVSSTGEIMEDSGEGMMSGEMSEEH